MLIQEQMGFKGLLCFIALVLVLTFAAVGSEGNKRTDEINRDTAELLWFNCRIELIHAKKGVKDLELQVPEKFSRSNGILSRSGLLANEKKQKATCLQNPHVKQALLDCLRLKNNHFLVSGEESGSNKVYNKYLGPLFASYDVPRQRKLLESLPEVPAPSPAVGSPIPSLEPSPVPAPSSSQVPSSQQPDESSVKPFPPESSDLSLQPTAGGYASTVQSPSASLQPSKKNSSRRSVVIAVIVTAPVTFFVTVLLFLCYLKRRTGSEDGEKDERPLLSLSLSSYSVGNSIDQGKLGSQSLSTKSNHNQSVPSLNGTVSFGASDVAATALADDSPEVVFPLKPLPGRSGTSGLLPLNPSPSKSDLSPPEPPRLNPSAGKVTTPPPPPPIPPTSLKPSTGSSHPPPPPPPPSPPVPSEINTALHLPPPHPKSGPPPPRPPAIGSRPPLPPPLGPSHPSTVSNEGVDAVAPKAKLKPFFWDKVLANPDQSMVWHQIKSGSFQFNEEMIETLFGYTAAEKNRNETKKGSLSQDPPTQYIQIMDSKKSQNLSILLRALNVTTEEVCDALLEGNELPSELLQTLLRMAPTAEEELKLKLFKGELSRLGPAERFLKGLVDIPFAFKRLESLLFMCTLQEEGSIIKESFGSLEAACMELKESRLFLKLLEAVLKTGNRMNDGTFRGGAQAFKLDTLLKLSDVKGVDGKTTLLHFVVQEIIRSEGVRAARAARESKSLSSFKSDNRIEDSSHDSEEHYCNLGLEVVSGLSGELENVKKAAFIDAESLRGTVAKLSSTLVKTREFLNSDMKNIGEESGFHRTLKSFVQNAEVDVMWLLEEEKRIMALVKRTTDYFHGNSGKDEGLRVFLVVRDFLIMLDKVCKEVKNAPSKQNKRLSSESSTVPPASKLRQPPPNPHQWLFPAIRDRRIDDSSSDDDIH